VLLLPGTGDATPGRTLVLSPTPAQLAVAETERQREELRLLYVALTRARHALWVGVSGLQVGAGKAYVWHRSAIGYLLSGAAAQPPEQRLADVRALADASPGVVVEQVPAAEGLPLPPVTALQRRDTRPALAPPPVYSAQFDRDWAISSYSALVRDAAGGPPGRARCRRAWSVTTSPARQRVSPSPANRAASPGTAFPAAPWPATSCTTSWSGWRRRVLRSTGRTSCSARWLVAASGRAGANRRRRRVAGCARSARPRCRRWACRWRRWACSPEMEFWLPSDGLQAGRIDACAGSTCSPAAPARHCPSDGCAAC
jgi:exodeoxyribonuclease V beta subunit